MVKKRKEPSEKASLFFSSSSVVTQETSLRPEVCCRSYEAKVERRPDAVLATGPPSSDGSGEVKRGKEKKNKDEEKEKSRGKLQQWEPLRSA